MKDKPKKALQRALATRPGQFLSLAFENSWQLIKLAALWLAFSIPVITAFAAYGASVRCIVKMCRKNNLSLFSDFWQHFKSEFWRSTLIGALCAFCAAACFVSGSYYKIRLDSTAVQYVALILFAVLFLFIICIFLYYSIVRASVHLSFGGCVRNSVLLFMISLPVSFALMVALACLVLLCAAFPVLLIFSPVLLMLYSLLCAYCIEPRVIKYMTENGREQ